MRVRSLSQEDILEKEMTTRSSILAWEIPWREEPGGLRFTESQREPGTGLSTHRQHNSWLPAPRGRDTRSAGPLTKGPGREVGFLTLGQNGLREESNRHCSEITI